MGYLFRRTRCQPPRVCLPSTSRLAESALGWLWTGNSTPHTISLLLPVTVNTTLRFTFRFRFSNNYFNWSGITEWKSGKVSTKLLLCATVQTTEKFGKHRLGFPYCYGAWLECFYCGVYYHMLLLRCLLFRYRLRLYWKMWTTTHPHSPRTYTTCESTRMHSNTALLERYAISS